MHRGVAVGAGALERELIRQLGDRRPRGALDEDDRVLRQQRGERDEVIRGVNDGQAAELSKNGTYASVAEAKRDKGDEWSGYRYTL